MNKYGVRKLLRVGTCGATIYVQASTFATLFLPREPVQTLLYFTTPFAQHQLCTNYGFQSSYPWQ